MKNKIITGLMPKTFKSGLATVSALLLFAGSSHAALTLVGTYDPGSDANDADRSATFGSGSVAGITSANVLTLGTFQGLVSTAFTNGNGGVIDFEGVGDSLTVTNSSTTFATSSFGGRTLSFDNTTNTSSNQMTFGAANTASHRIAISGDNVTGGVQNLNFESFSLTGGDPGDLLTHFGMTVLQRNQPLNINVTATFSDDSTLTFTQFSLADSDNGPDNVDDTFFGFVAPDGLSIKSVELASSQFTSYDDIGFIVTPVPEASTVALLGLCGIALILRRRRS